MTPPTPTVRKVDPPCYQCGGTNELILGDGPVICRTCVRIGVRLAVVSNVSLSDPNHWRNEGSPR